MGGAHSGGPARRHAFGLLFRCRIVAINSFKKRQELTRFPKFLMPQPYDLYYSLFVAPAFAGDGIMYTDKTPPPPPTSSQTATAAENYQYSLS